MNFKLPKKNWKLFPKDSMTFILNESKEYLGYTLNESDKITNRAFSLVLVLTTILISILGFTFSRMISNEIDKTVYLNIYLSIIITGFIVYLSTLIFPKQMMQKGRKPNQLAKESLLINEKLTHEEIYLSFIIREVEDIQDKIDFNLAKNEKRRNKLELAMYLIAVLIPIYFLIAIYVIN